MEGQPCSSPLLPPHPQLLSRDPGCPPRTVYVSASAPKAMARADGQW